MRRPQHHDAGFWHGRVNAFPHRHGRWRLEKRLALSEIKASVALAVLHFHLGIVPRRIAPELCHGSQGEQHELWIGAAALAAHKDQLHGGGEQHGFAPGARRGPRFWCRGESPLPTTPALPEDTL